MLTFGEPQVAAAEEEEEEDEEIESGEELSQVSEEGNVYDDLRNFQEQVEEYKFVEEQFIKNKIKYDEKILKHAVMYDNMLTPDMDK